MTKTLELPKRKKLPTPPSAVFQSQSVVGKETLEAGLAIPEVNITKKLTANGILRDAIGKFRIYVGPGCR